jgi:hypothetical protein
MPTYNYPADFAKTHWHLLDGDIYVSSIGSDTTGDGSPRKPYATFKKAIAVATNGKKIVAGTGNYNEQVNGAGKNTFIIADGLVVMKAEDSGTAFTNMGASAIIDGIRIYNYTFAYDGTINVLRNCRFRNCGFANFQGVIDHCVLFNASLLATGNTYLSNCTMIQVRSGSPASNSNKFIEIEDTHFDDRCFFDLSSSVTSVFDYCNQQLKSSIRIDGTFYATAAAVHAAFSQYQANGKSDAPLFNKPTVEDFTLTAASTLIGAGSKGDSIGAMGESLSQNSGTLGSATLINVTLTPAGRYELVPGFTQGSILSQVIDLLSPKALGRIDLFADQQFETPPKNAVIDRVNANTIPNKITFEMRYSNDREDIQRRELTEFSWTKKPSVDAIGRSNGQDGYDPTTAKGITARFVQFRVTLFNQL